MTGASQAPEIGKSNEAQVHILHKTAVELRGNATAKGGKVTEDCDELEDIDRDFGEAGEVVR